MKKSTKLLSVILAIVMLFTSMSVMASAAKTSYQTSSDLDSLQAYSPYGAVTRLSTEERLSILFDYLDQVLAQANISMAPISIATETLTINLTSIDAALDTVDNVQDLLNSGLFGFGSFFVSLGVLEDIDLDSWDAGMSRDGTDHTYIISELLTVLNVNANVVADIVRSGNLDLGIVGNFVDLSAVGQYISDIPGLIKGLITPMLERKDDTVEWAETLAAAASMDSIVTAFVQGLFTKPQSTTTVKADSTGALQSDHVLPTAADGLRYYYVAGTTSGLPSYTCYVYNTDTDGYDMEEGAFILTEEVEGSGVYVFQKTTGETLKYYEPGSYWLPSLVKSGSAADIMNISTQTGVQMLYNMIPYVFGEMAPVVLNGSVKKLVAEWFGAQFNYVGEVGSDEVNALGSDPIFTGEQGEYLWEWSDYAVIDGEHYYRFEDSVYQADLSNKNAYMDIVNWDYVIPDDLLNDYIPGADGNTPSAAGYNTILQGLNDFLGEVIDLVLAPNVVSAINWTDGSNSNLLENVKKAARAVVTIAPETIFGEHYADDEYYQLLIDESATDQEILCGIAAKLLEFLMPQLILPSASSLEGQSLGAMLAMVIRELATQLLPTYNYDALIFADYNTKTLLSGKDNSYWLDVCLTMGVDIGMAYLRNLADLGEDTEVGYDFADSKTYELAAFEQNPQAWEASVDWVIDWALSNDYEWSWKMENLVDCGETVDLATAQDPWVKLGNILKNLLPIDQILNVNTEDSHWLETALRDNFVLSLLNLDVGNIVGDSDTSGLLDIPNDSTLFNDSLLTTVVSVVRDLLNDLLYKVAGNYTFFDAGTYTSIDSVLNQQNLGNLVGALLQRLSTAQSNGLLDTAMPFLNFFVGWTTDAQTYSDPNFTLTDTATGDDYLLASNGQVDGTLSVLNDSMGMLLKHGESYDSAYDIYITNITVSDPNLTAYLSDGSSALSTTLISPASSYSFRIRGAYTQNEAITITTTYYFIGKDGQPLGGTQNLITYAYVTNTVGDIYGSYERNERIALGAIVGLDITGRSTTSTVVRRAEDLAGALAGLNVAYQNNRDAAADTRGATITPSSNFIVSSGMAEGLLGDETLPGSATTTVYPFTVNQDADLSTLVSGQSYPIGTVAMTFYDNYLGQRGERTFTTDMGNLYYADMGDLIDLYESEAAAARAEANYESTAWNTYEQAMLNAVALIYGAPMQADFATKYSADNINAHLEALEAAITALEDARITETSVDSMEAALETAEGEDGINFQDYRFFEYWDYEEIRNEAWDILAAYETPEAPDKYIEGNSLSEAEINAIAGAETNTTLKSAIESTMLDPSAADLEAYQEALAAYEEPSYSDLYLADVTAKIPYYAGFLNSVAVTTEKQFLAKELAYAAAQNYVETAWSTDSWGAYEAALSAANTVNNDGSALQSEVFDAKYNLMLAQNNLVPAEDSARDTGVYDSLNSLIATADSIFADTEGAWTVKESVEPADAYKQLVEALGYEYEDADGYTQNLYWDSAKAFVATDRVIGDATTSATNAMADKLQAAIDNFVSTAAEPELQPSENGTAAGTIIDRTSYCANGAGFIYGIDVYDFYGDAEILDKLATPAGSIRVTANDMGVYSTGAKIELLSASGDVVETYYYIYFGDINGDGVVDFSDVTTVEGINSFMDFDFAAGDGSVAGMAADINGDEVIDFTDVTYVEGVNSYIDFPMQSETAATVAANKGISQ